MRQGVEGVESRRGDWVPVEHGEGIVVGWVQVVPLYYVGDVSDDGVGRIQVV